MGITSFISVSAPGATNDYGSAITYKPQHLNIDGKQMVLLDYDSIVLKAIQNMTGEQERKYLFDNNYALNKFGTGKAHTSNTKITNPFERIDHYTNSGEIHATFDFFNTKDINPKGGTSKGNLISAANKGDFSFAFAYLNFLRYYDQNNFFYITPKSSWSFIYALGEIKDRDGSGGNYTARFNYSASGKLTLPADAWKAADYVSFSFKGGAVNGGPVDTDLYNGLLLGRDTKGPKILSVNIQKEMPAPGSYMYSEKTGDFNFANFKGCPVLKAEDLGKRIYISVQFDEPVQFKKDFVENNGLQDLELVIQTIGKDGSSARPAAAKFLKYVPAADDAAPAMIFEYEISREGYYAFSYISVSKNENFDLYNNITDMAGNSFGLENGMQPSESKSYIWNPSVYDYISGKSLHSNPTVDMEPFAVEDIRIEPIYSSFSKKRENNEQYLQIWDGVAITVNLNKQLMIRAANRPWENIPAITTNIKRYLDGKDDGFVTINPNAGYEDFVFQGRIKSFYNISNYKAVTSTTRKSINSPLRTSITYYIPFEKFARNMQSSYTYSSDSEIKITSMDLDGNYMDSSGYQLTCDPITLAPNAFYYIDAIPPMVDVEITKPETNIIKVKAYAEDNIDITKGSVIFSVTTNIESIEPLQYQISNDGDYDSSWESVEGKSFTAHTALMKPEIWLFVKIPDLAEGSKIGVRVEAADNTGNTGVIDSSFNFVYDTISPYISLSQALHKELAGELIISDFNETMYEYVWLDGYDATMPEPSSDLWSLPETAGKGLQKVTIIDNSDLSDNQMYEKTLWVKVKDLNDNQASPIPINCSYNNIYGEIFIDSVIPEDPNQFITDYYPKANITFKNIVSYSWVWIEYNESQFTKEELSDPSILGEDFWEGNETPVEDDDPESEGYTNIEHVTFALTPQMRVMNPYVSASNYKEAKELNRPVFLALRTTDEHGNYVYKIFQFNTFYSDGGIKFAHVRFSTNDRDGNRIDFRRHKAKDLYGGVYGDSEFAIYDGIFQYDDVYNHDFIYNTIEKSSILNSPPLNDFAEVEFTVRGNQGTGITSLDLDHSDGIGTKIVLNKVTFLSGDDSGGGGSINSNGKMIKDETDGTLKFYEERILSKETVLEWELTESHLKTLFGGKLDWDRDGKSDYFGDYTFVLGVDINAIDKVGYEYYEAGGEAKMRLIRYEFCVQPVYVEGITGNEEPLSMFSFQNNLPGTVLYSVDTIVNGNDEPGEVSGAISGEESRTESGTVSGMESRTESETVSETVSGMESGTESRGGSGFEPNNLGGYNTITLLSEPQAPYVASLIEDDGNIVDNSTSAPRILFSGKPKAYIRMNMPASAEMMFFYATDNRENNSSSTGHSYMLRVGTSKDLVWANGRGQFVIDTANYANSQMYDSEGNYAGPGNCAETLHIIDIMDLDSKFKRDEYDYYQYKSEPKAGDMVSVYYQLEDHSTGQLSPIYRLDFIYDDIPPVVELSISEERPTNSDVTVSIGAVYDGHAEGTGEDEYFVTDTPVPNIEITVKAEYYGGDGDDKEVASVNKTYIFNHNGTFIVTATDTAGNSTTVTHNINNIDRYAPVITGEPTVDAKNGRFMLNATVTDGAYAYIKFDEEYTAYLTNGFVEDTMFSVKDGSVLGALISNFEDDKINLEVYIKYGVKMKTAKLLVYDDSGNVSELVLARDLEGVPPAITNPDKKYVYGSSLTFSVPTKLMDMTGDKTDIAGGKAGYAISHENLPIYADGRMYMRYMDLFNREYSEEITADIFGGSHIVQISPSTPTNGNVKITVKAAAGFTVEGEKIWTDTVTQNGNISYRIVGQESDKEYIIPINNIDKIAPTALYKRIVNGTESFSEQGSGGKIISTVAGSVTYTVLGFDKKNVSFEEGEVNSITFTQPGSHTFHFTDAAGNRGQSTVSEENTAFINPEDREIVKYRMTYTAGGNSQDPIKIGQQDSDEPPIQFAITNKDISVLVEALNQAGDVISSTMEMIVPSDSVKYYLAQNTVVFTSGGTTTVKLKTDINELNAIITIPEGIIDKIAPTGSVEYVMLAVDEHFDNGVVSLEFKKGGIKAYLIGVEPNVQVQGEGVLYDTDGYFIYFEKNGSGIFYLMDEAGNTSSVIVGAYGIDFSGPTLVNESWYSNIAANADATDYTTGNGMDEVLSTATNNSIRLFFSFDEQIGNVNITAYTKNGNTNVAVSNTSDYISYVVFGNTLTIEFKKNCQAEILVYDIRGNSGVALWRPEDGPITVIDKEAPKITGQTAEVIDNKVHIAITFDEKVTSANDKSDYRDSYTTVFNKNGIYPLTFADQAGNVVTTIVVIDQIDDLSPSIYYALQIVPEDSKIIYSDPEKTQVEATNGNVEIAIEAMDKNNAAITVVNLNMPSIPMILKEPTITNGANRTYTSAVTIEENGIYQISAVDDYGNTNSVYVKIDFIDKTAPVITVKESKTLEIVAGITTAEELKSMLLAGVTAKDEREGSIPVTADISEVNLDNPGTYTIKYIVADSLGNIRTRSRMVAVLNSARKAFLIDGKKVPANDVYNTASGTITIQAPGEGYKLYVAEGYKTRAQMKYLTAMEGNTIEALKKGYYTILAQNEDHDVVMAYIYVY
jgi:hypothetical protein